MTTRRRNDDNSRMSGVRCCKELFSPVRFTAVPMLAAMLVASRAAPARAQACHPPTDSHEARLQAFYAVPLAFSPAAPTPLPPGALWVGAELAPIPAPDPDIERTSICYESKGEHTRLSPVFARPRVAVGLPGGVAIEGSWVPPLTIGDARVHLGSLALSLARPLGTPAARQALSAMVRVQATFGSVSGAITCPRSALQETDPAAPCFGAQPSHDTYHPTMYGAEGALAWALASGRVALYGGGGATWLRPRFRAVFTEGDEENAENTLVVVNLTRGAVFGGITYRPWRALDLGAQVYAVPKDATTFRFAAGWRVR